ncbi:MAG TPA: DGQHR domain-containing protein [Pirellulales bacterium]|jgi:DGQHR domain-containing protein|nr:DGQHR domain-containing protein [Pirellulales bacterium]
MTSRPIQTISVIVPENPFVPTDVKAAKHCLAALDVTKLMEWWPGTPHSPHRNPKKVKAIQRSLDWKRVAQIAAYLLQEEIVDAPERLCACFASVYEVKKHEKGRIWPPRVPRVINYVRSSYPVFSNVLLHLNGATVRMLEDGAAKLTFKDDADLNFSVIDGQHRINGAYFAVMLSRESEPGFKWEIPAEIFVDLDDADAPPKRQAQIFIDVNFYQKKVDRSLVADLFPTTREPGMLGKKERAQDLGRKLMLEVGPLVGMIQIPGIKYGVGDVVTLATLNSAIEDVLESLDTAEISSLEDQASFLALCLEAWLEATGRREDLSEGEKLTPQNVVYQGRVMVSFITLIPACLWTLKTKRIDPLSDEASEHLAAWLKKSLKKASLLEDDQFIDKSQFKEHGFLGSGGIARFRDVLWCSVGTTASVDDMTAEDRAEKARETRGRIYSELSNGD